MYNWLLQTCPAGVQFQPLDIFHFSTRCAKCIFGNVLTVVAYIQSLFSYIKLPVFMSNYLCAIKNFQQCTWPNKALQRELSVKTTQLTQLCILILIFFSANIPQREEELVLGKLREGFL